MEFQLRKDCAQLLDNFHGRLCAYATGRVEAPGQAV